MRILHLSDAGLPDWRVEKAAATGLKDGHEVYFAGDVRANIKSSIFSEIYPIHWSSWSMVGTFYLWQRIKKQIANLLKIVNPDIVHAHNIASARIASELGLPLVFDNHEFFKVYSKVIVENRNIALDQKQRSLLRVILRSLALSFLNSQTISVWTKWEDQLVSKYPTLTVSDQIAEDLKRNSNSNKVFVVPNFPMKFESENFIDPIPHKKISTVYSVAENKNIRTTNRDVSNLTAVFDKKQVGRLTIIGWEAEAKGQVRATGFLSRKEMFKEMSHHSIGIIPWKKHWSHKYVSPNKAYEYAHAGLFVGVTSDMVPVIKNLGENCMTFEDYDDLESKLRYFSQNLEELHHKRIKIFKFAHENLIWEKHEHHIFDAYKKA